jgi:hypothetical protein
MESVVERPYSCKLVGCKCVLRKSLGLLVLLKSIRQGLWIKVIPIKKLKTIFGTYSSTN